MKRALHSHKGENGKVAVIGGSRTMHGAPLFASLAAEASGADLIFVCLPCCHGDIAKMQSLNFQIHPFDGDELSQQDRQPILELLATMDAAVLGPGLDRNPATLRVVKEIIAASPCPLVLDASALQPWTVERASGKGYALTPHAGELERMGICLTDIGRTAQKHTITILAKGHVDRIADTQGNMRTVRGGNAGLTVGGTGDALSGLTAGLLAQHLPPADACRLASTVIKKAGETLFKTHGYAYGTRRIIDMIPVLLQQYSK